MRCARPRAWSLVLRAPLRSWAYPDRRLNQRSGNSESTGTISKPRSCPFGLLGFFLPFQPRQLCTRASRITRARGPMLRFQQMLKLRPDLKQLSANESTCYEWRGDCLLGSRVAKRSNMTLKIKKYGDGNSTTIRLIGRMQSEHLEELEKQIRESGPAIILDLDEVTLVDVEIVRFLGTCEARGATLLNCSPYIRDWIGNERD